MLLLKVTAVNNVWFDTTSFLFMGLNINIRCIIYGSSKSDAIILLEHSVLDFGIYKMHAKEIYIKNQVFDYYDNLIKPKKIETKNVVID